MKAVFILSDKFKSLFIIYPTVWIIVSTIWNISKNNYRQLIAHYVIILVYLIAVGLVYFVDKKIQEKRKRTKEG
ncbi:hypothetical protein C1N73_28470 (plasmid) [Priestia aryabhattai]